MFPGKTMVIKYFYTSGPAHKKVNTSPFVTETSYQKKTFTLQKLIAILQDIEIDTSTIESFKYYNEEKEGFITLDFDKTYTTVPILILLLQVRDETDKDSISIDGNDPFIDRNSSGIPMMPFESESAISFKFDLSRQPSAIDFQPDLIYLYASPIVKNMVYRDAFTDFSEMIDYQGEIEKIVDSIMQTKKNFTAAFEPCDFETFVDAIRKTPKILHISCHGIIREKDGVKKFHLCLEKKGVLTEISEEKIRDALNSEERLSNIDLVFISACHSEILGKIFFESGIKNVICVNRMTKISDFAAQLFSSTLYQFLVNGDSITDAFEKSKNLFRNVAFQGKLQECCCNHEHTSDCGYKILSKKLQNTFHKMYHIKKCTCSYSEYHTHKTDCKYIKGHLNDLRFVKINNGTLAKICCCSPNIPHNESNKFILLSNESFKNYIIFPNAPVGRVVILNNNCFLNASMFRKKKIKFIGRNMEIKTLMDFLDQHDKHFILVYGPKGLGKKSFAKFASMYLFERKIIEDVFFIEIVTLFYSYDMMLNKIKDIANCSKSNKMLILFSFPAILEQILFKSINEILNEIMRSYSQFFFCFLIDTNFNKTNFENEFNKHSEIAKLPLKPLTYDSAETLFYSLISEKQILSSSEIDKIFAETNRYPSEIFFIASLLQNSKHPDKLTAYLNERRKNFEKSKNEIEKTATINTASSNLIFLLATMPMGLSQTQLKIIDVSYENEVNRINIITSRFKSKLNENWFTIETSLISFILLKISDEIKIQCVKNAFLMYAVFLMSYIRMKSMKKIPREWNAESEFSGYNNEGIWRTFSNENYAKLLSLCIEQKINMKYIKKMRYNIEYLIENNKKIISQLISENFFLECFEQVTLLLPSVFKMQNRIIEAKEILRSYILLCADFNLINSQERLRLFLLSLDSNAEFSPKEMFADSTCLIGKAEAFVLKAANCIVRNEANEDVIANYTEAMKIYEHIKHRINYAKTCYNIANVYYKKLKLRSQAKVFYEMCLNAICEEEKENKCEDDKVKIDIMYIKANISLAKLEDDYQNYESAFLFANDAYHRALQVNVDFINTATQKLLYEIKQKKNYAITLIASNSLINAYNEQVFACANTANYIAQSLYEKINKKIRIKNVLLTPSNLLDVLSQSGDILIIQCDDYTNDGELIFESAEGKSVPISHKALTEMISSNIQSISYKLIIFGFINSSLILPVFSQFKPKYTISFNKTAAISIMTPLAQMNYNILISAFIVHFIENIITESIEASFAKAKITFLNRLSRNDEFGQSVMMKLNTEDNSFITFAKDLNCNYIFKKDEYIFEKSKLKEGKVQFNRPINPKTLPISSKRLIGKSMKMFELIKLIKENNVVNLYGMSGVGKTSLGMEVVKFFYRHELFKNGIFFCVEHKTEILKLSDFVKNIIATNVQNNSSSKKIENILIVIDKIDKSITKAKKQKIKFIDKINKKIHLLLISRKVIQSNQIVNYQLQLPQGQKSSDKDICNTSLSLTKSVSSKGKKGKKSAKDKKKSNNKLNTTTMTYNTFTKQKSTNNFLTLNFDLDESELNLVNSSSSNITSNMIKRNQSGLSSLTTSNFILDGVD